MAQNETKKTYFKIYTNVDSGKLSKIDNLRTVNSFKVGHPPSARNAVGGLCGQLISVEKKTDTVMLFIILCTGFLQLKKLENSGSQIPWLTRESR